MLNKAIVLKSSRVGASSPPAAGLSFTTVSEDLMLVATDVGVAVGKTVTSVLTELIAPAATLCLSAPPWR